MPELHSQQVLRFLEHALAVPTLKHERKATNSA